jgi:hypothetical protein
MKSKPESTAAIYRCSAAPALQWQPVAHLAVRPPLPLATAIGPA